jgi:ankyrin repeat protein
MDALPSIYGNLETVKDIIKTNNMDIDKKYGINKETLLHYAACNGWLDIVKYLVEHGADVNICDSDGDDPLHFAIMFNYDDDIVKYLLDNGANKEHRNNRHETAHDLAIHHDFNNLAKYIESYEYIPTKGVHLDDVHTPAIQ